MNKLSKNDEIQKYCILNQSTKYGYFSTVGIFSYSFHNKTGTSSYRD